MKQPLANRDEDIILWWKRHCHQYPVLGAMARLYLAIPGTSTASERVSSAAGNLVSEKRTRLSCDSIQANMTLRSWRRAGLIKSTLVISLMSALIHLILFNIRQILDIRRLI